MSISLLRYSSFHLLVSVGILPTVVNANDESYKPALTAGYEFRPVTKNNQSIPPKKHRVSPETIQPYNRYEEVRQFYPPLPQPNYARQRFPTSPFRSNMSSYNGGNNFSPWGLMPFGQTNNMPFNFNWPSMR